MGSAGVTGFLGGGAAQFCMKWQQDAGVVVEREAHHASRLDEVQLRDAARQFLISGERESGAADGAGGICEQRGEGGEVFEQLLFRENGGRRCRGRRVVLCV